MAFDADEQVDEIDDDELEPQDGDGEFDDGEDDGDPVAAKEPTIEDVARELGWTPREKWRGDPRKWSPAAEYVRKGAAWNKENSKEVRELRERSAASVRILTESLQRQASRYEAQLKAARRDAIRAGDADAVEQIDQEIEQNRLPVDEDTKAEILVENIFQSEPEVALFWEENAWIFEDEELAERMLRFWDTDDVNKPFDHVRAVERAEKYLRKAYPDRFDAHQGRPQEQPRQRREPPVYSDTGRARGANLASKLPDDALKEWRELEAEGKRTGKPLFASREEFAEVYFGNTKGQKR